MAAAVAGMVVVVVVVGADTADPLRRLTRALGSNTRTRVTAMVNTSPVTIKVRLVAAMAVDRVDPRVVAVETRTLRKSLRLQAKWSSTDDCSYYAGLGR